MASIIFKGLTVAAGLGLAIGIGSGNSRTEENHMGTKLPDDDPEAGPIAARLDRIEARISAIEGRSGSSAGYEAGSEIEALHAQVAEHRKKVSVQVAGVEKRFEVLAREIPAVLESIVGPRVDDLRLNLRGRDSTNAEKVTRLQIRTDGLGDKACGANGACGEGGL